jgi:uncharacterized membrane protein
VDDVTIARALHVVAVVLWIGGVGLVTTVLLPLLRRLPTPAQRVALFVAIESPFRVQARLSIALAGLSGVWMLIRIDAWDRFAGPSYWWLHAVVLLWLVFAALIFLLEPLVLHRRFAERARRHPEATFRKLHRVHMVLFALALLTILGAVAGSHGLMLFV